MSWARRNAGARCSLAFPEGPLCETSGQQWAATLLFCSGSSRGDLGHVAGELKFSTVKVQLAVLGGQLTVTGANSFQYGRVFRADDAGIQQLVGLYLRQTKSYFAE